MLDRAQAARARQLDRAADRSAKLTEKGRTKARGESGIDPGKKSPTNGQAQGKALRRSALRHGARMAGSAGLAAGIGLGSLLWNFKHPSRAYHLARRVWARLTGRARKVREERDAALRGETGPGQGPVPAETVNDPNRTTPMQRAAARFGRKAARLRLDKTEQDRETAVSTEQTTSMTKLSDAAEVMLQAANTFEPEVMAEFETLIDDLPEAMVHVQETLRVLAELAQERLPVHPAVVEEIGEGFRAMNRVIESLDEVGAVYRRVHAEDIERIESPRNGVDAERKWNV